MDVISNRRKEIRDWRQSLEDSQLPEPLVNLPVMMLLDRKWYDLRRRLGWSDRNPPDLDHSCSLLPPVVLPSRILWNSNRYLQESIRSIQGAGRFEVSLLSTSYLETESPTSFLTASPQPSLS